MADDYKEIRVTIEMDGKKYGYRQHVNTDGTESPDTIRDYTAYAIAKTIQDTIIEYWEEN